MWDIILIYFSKNIYHNLRHSSCHKCCTENQFVNSSIRNTNKYLMLLAFRETTSCPKCSRIRTIFCHESDPMICCRVCRNCAYKVKDIRSKYLQYIYGLSTDACQFKIPVFLSGPTFRFQENVSTVSCRHRHRHSSSTI